MRRRTIFESDRSSSRGQVAAWLLIAVAVAGVTTGLDALVVEPQLLITTTEFKLPLSHGGRLARALDGARVMHLSDLHVLGYGMRERHLLSRLKSLKPDMILMTGDFGDGPEGMKGITRLLGGYRPPLGAYAVLGNNDHYRGQRDAIVAALREAGVTLLVNSSVTVQAARGPVVIAGVDDPHYGRDDIEAAMRDVPEDVPVVLLAHSPDLLQRKGRALLINAGDARCPWRYGVFWQDGAHMRPDTGEVIFPTSGQRRIRVVHREDGVGIEEIRLVPMSDATDGPPRRLGRKMMAEPAHVPGEVVIKAGQIKAEDIHGGWERRPTDGGTMLLNVPDVGLLENWVDLKPASYFESEFEAQAGTRYHVWVRVVSSNGRGTSDSAYVQFTDSLGAGGRPDYRIGVEMPGVDTGRVDLMLAGHEHGGQVRLPFVGPLEPNVRRSPYQMGSYDVDGMPLFVSRGFGWSSLPVRFWCPPEVVVIDTNAEGEHAGTL